MDNIIVVEDDSVRKKIQKTAEKLERKYTASRKVNEKELLEGRPWWKKLISAAINLILALLIVFSCAMSLSVIVSKINRTVPSFAGYSALTIVSGSMVAAGYEVGQTIVTKSVDPHTLSIGDRIAFYVYEPDYRRYSSAGSTEVTTQQEVKTETPFFSFFGLKSAKITEASRNGARLVFHEIVGIYDDANGERWFKTKGASNPGVDTWITSESLVLGILDEGGFGGALASILTTMTNNMATFIIIIMIPLLALAAMLSLQLIRSMSRIKLEMDVVEEKRKLTDEICVKNNIGFRMDKQTKLKVLAQAKDDQKLDYISLLWEDGSAPNSIRKYYLRHNQMLKYNKQLLELNRMCEQMMQDGVKMDEIARFYTEGKTKINSEREKTEARIKKMRKAYNAKPQI